MIIVHIPRCQTAGAISVDWEAATDLSTVRQLAQKTRIEMNFSEYNGETGGIYKSKVDVARDASACTLS